MKGSFVWVKILWPQRLYFSLLQVYMEKLVCKAQSIDSSEIHLTPASSSAKGWASQQNSNCTHHENLLLVYVKETPECFCSFRNKKKSWTQGKFFNPLYPHDVTWVWASFRSWWWTGKPGVLPPMGWQSQTWLSDWTELNWYPQETAWWALGRQRPGEKQTNNHVVKWRRWTFTGELEANFLIYHYHTWHSIQTSPFLLCRWVKKNETKLKEQTSSLLFLRMNLEKQSKNILFESGIKSGMPPLSGQEVGLWIWSWPWAMDLRRGWYHLSATSQRRTRSLEEGKGLCQA